MTDEQTEQYKAHPGDGEPAPEPEELEEVNSG